ncbi:hypothetical protein AWB90_20110 [Mycobacterium paraense]|uniref:Uncharacterized protein n=1 Tax=Mycobacterium paraense TaxID=767916 RepID=A0A1X2A642_9MYCO|nr:hypothetical protein [Mycobacterium paraense]ORW41609.1 hypothetical protein AWB90_20110 [Mycobacterium paraense]
MPVKIWDTSPHGLTSVIVTNWDIRITAEERRREAEDLDRELDVVLDRALAQVRNHAVRTVPPEFVRAWAFGTALGESNVTKNPALVNEIPQLLWRALARKVRLGARSDGTTDTEWVDLRPQRASEPRREGGRLDHFEMCRWLAEQSLSEATTTFGGSIRNVWQMLERPTLRPLVVRSALLDWLRQLPPHVRNELTQPSTFAELMKRLRSRWPDRGPGSAKRPVHYTRDELRVEIQVVLKGFVPLESREVETT